MPINPKMKNFQATSRDVKEKEIAELVQKVIEHFDADPKREGLQETPKRVAKAYFELLGGYEIDPSIHYKKFESNGFSEMVTATNIDFYSLCEHHMIPFFGKVNIGYIPNGHVLGLSKFARIVDVFARRLQTQENLTKQILESINEHMQPKGVVVQIQAKHMCVSMRGVKNQGFETITTMKSGVFNDDRELYSHFLSEVQIFNSK